MKSALKILFMCTSFSVVALVDYHYLANKPHIIIEDSKFVW
ncbi:20281_t:CDS:2 [Racocetra persica]|uniref:20281_t:CDS:1 n=1 Tax=Racocetra persica TaxID=160502 RepID=A0ACA9KEQ5_9GLOM|nr:20281_t:CDS:2 [Racocetra persica]